MNEENDDGEQVSEDEGVTEDMFHKT